MNPPEYVIEVTIHAPGREPFHYRLGEAVTVSAGIPLDTRRRYVEEHVYRIISAALDKLFDER